VFGHAKVWQKKTTLIVHRWDPEIKYSHSYANLLYNKWPILNELYFIWWRIYFWVGSFAFYPQLTC